MSAEANKAAVRKYFEEFWDKGNASAADDFNAPDCVVHFPDSELNGVAEVKNFGLLFQGAFSGISVVADDLIAEGDMLAGRWTARCTHTADFMGVAPTGNGLISERSSILGGMTAHEAGGAREQLAFAKA
jgi:predicted ester cyclase